MESSLITPAMDIVAKIALLFGAFYQIVRFFSALLFGLVHLLNYYNRVEVYLIINFFKLYSSSLQIRY